MRKIKYIFNIPEIAFSKDHFNFRLDIAEKNNCQLRYNYKKLI